MLYRTDYLSISVMTPEQTMPIIILYFFSKSQAQHYYNNMIN